MYFIEFAEVLCWMFSKH